MAKVVFVLGFGIGLAILAIAMTGSPQASGVMPPDVHAAAMSAAHCSLHEVSLDEGYGVSRKVLQRVCAVTE